MISNIGILTQMLWIVWMPVWALAVGFTTNGHGARAGSLAGERWIVM